MSPFSKTLNGQTWRKQSRGSNSGMINFFVQHCSSSFINQITMPSSIEKSLIQRQSLKTQSDLPNVKPRGGGAEKALKVLFQDQNKESIYQRVLFFSQPPYEYFHSNISLQHLHITRATYQTYRRELFSMTRFQQRILGTHFCTPPVVLVHRKS